RHRLFEHLRSKPLSPEQLVRLLVNYGAHASLLRRLLLRAAAAMPEKAVGFVLENVRNEYGNGEWSRSHGLQVIDLIAILRERFAIPESRCSGIENGVRLYMRSVVACYIPDSPSGLYRPAITAGAITATEIMALEEFAAMQKAFARFGLDEHVWFDHVVVEAEHRDESLALVQYFLPEHQTSVEHGLAGVLEANVNLYDGLLASIENEGSC
ncbi:MAG: iron-containing redox enzyme family protein, partial [Cyanobacteria bacterium HKST-UBA02]|nr:iron-containing redox enzyme family protein [Cyanobacteria bacterium HKST-UBA02]